MSTLVIYHTHPGGDRSAAEAVARESGADSEFIRESRAAEGVMGLKKNILWGYTEEEQIGVPIHDPAHYDLVAVGTDVGVDGISEAVRSFLKAYRNDLRDVAFFVVQESGDAERYFSEMADLCGKQPVATARLSPSDPASTQDAVRQFAEAIRH